MLNIFKFVNYVFYLFRVRVHAGYYLSLLFLCYFCGVIVFLLSRVAPTFYQIGFIFQPGPFLTYLFFAVTLFLSTFYFFSNAVFKN